MRGREINWQSLRPNFTPFWWLDADTRYIEVFSAIAALVFGTLLLAPNDMFTTFSTYKAMAMIAPEHVWGALFILLWLTQSYAMCGNVFVARLPSALLAFCLWGTTSLTFLWTAPLGFAAYLFGLLTLFMGWIVIRGPASNEQ